jgi:outer membrane biosynthesis protein TonB
MRIATLISVAFHLSVFLLAWLGLPSSHVDIVPMQVIDVDLNTDVADLKPAPAPKPEPKPEPKKAEVKPPPPPPPPPPTPAPEPPAVKPEPKTAAKPPEPKPEPEAVPVPEPKPELKKAEVKPEPKPEPPKVAEVPRPRSKPKPPPPPAEKKPEPAPKPKDDFASVLKTVSKLKDTAPQQPAEPKQKQKESFEQQVAQTLERVREEAPRPSNAITDADLDAIRRQIEACWNIPAGARDAQDMTVQIRAIMNPDGRVRRAEIVDMARVSRDSFYRSMAESARRAVMNPRCQPLHLPVEKYDEWRVLLLNFDPRGMF